MKTDTFRKGRALVVGLTLMTTLAGAALAQAPDPNAPPPPGGFGGPGGGGGFGGPPPGGGFGGPGGGGGFGGPGGGRGGFGGRAPFAVGTVSAVDSNLGTITITSQFGGGGGNGGGNTQVIQVGPDAQVVSQTDTTVANLKVGDQVQVQGVPTGITASTITAGTPPAGLPGAGGGFGRQRGGGAGGNAAGGAAATQGFATATGTIKTLPTTADPHLAISLGTDAVLYLKVADGAKITRFTTLKLTDLKTGDRIIATGQTGADGTLAASAVGVNMPLGQGGPGGFGGFGGGQGGAGGRGGRGRRGGGGGFGGPNGGGGFGGPGGGGGGFGGPPPPGPADGGVMTQ